MEYTLRKRRSEFYYLSADTVSSLHDADGANAGSALVMIFPLTEIQLDGLGMH